MRTGSASGCIPRAALLLLAALTTLVSAAAYSTPFAPLDTPMSVSNAIHAPDGTAVTCQRVIVERIVARQTPAFFVVRDSFAAGSRIAVLCRPPVALARDQVVDMSGTMGTLPNGERVIVNPSITGYFDRSGSPLMPPPMVLDLDPWYGVKQPLPVALGPVAPADPSGPVGAALVTATPIGVAHFDSVSSLVSTRPAVMTPVELSCRRVCEVGDGFIVIGDDLRLAMWWNGAWSAGLGRLLT